MKRYRIISSDKYTTLEESINDFSEIHIIDNIQYQDADPDNISVLITYDTDNDDRARQIAQEETNKAKRELSCWSKTHKMYLIRNKYVL